MSQHGSEGKGQQFSLRGFDAVHGSPSGTSMVRVTARMSRSRRSATAIRPPARLRPCDRAA
jgi:hypothetical protein